MEIGAFDDPKIIKKILHAGKEFKPIEDGTKVSCFEVFEFLL